MNHPLICLCLLAAFARPTVSFAVSQGAPGCEVLTSELDLSHGNSAALSYSGKSLAQVFLAPDTLISSVTVWRPASEQAFGAGMHLYLCGVDSLLRPQPATDVLLDGPTIVLPVAGPTPAAVRFNLEPPFALPHKGHFAFAIKEEDPYCRNIIPLVVDTTMSYEEGKGWLVHAFADCHGLGSHAAAEQFDLVFAVEFCQPAVAVKPESWGSLRVRYR